MRLLKKTSIFALALIAGFSLTSCKSSKSSKAERDGQPAKMLETETPEAGLHSVYYDFDKFDIRADQRPAANATAEYLKEHEDLNVEVQGNTDERGSVEYNMALGTRRAKSLKNYLVTAGVPAAHISIVSFGKEKPLANGQNESAWAKNRRSDVVKK